MTSLHVIQGHVSPCRSDVTKHHSAQTRRMSSGVRSRRVGVISITVGRVVTVYHTGGNVTASRIVWALTMRLTVVQVCSCVTVITAPNYLLVNRF